LSVGLSLVSCTPEHSLIKRDYRNAKADNGANNPRSEDEKYDSDDGRTENDFSNKIYRNPAQESEGNNADSAYKKEKFYQTGVASWYGREFHGKKTASGELFDMNILTAAHKNLPFGTVIKVKNLNNGKTVTVRVNDRGPYKGNRIIDLSYVAAKKLDMLKNGKTLVGISILKDGSGIDEDDQKSAPDSLEAVSDDEAGDKSADSGNFILQTGAFYSKRNAENLKGKIEEMISTSVVVVHDGDLYKVRVVGLPTKHDADRCRKTLSREDISSYIIRRNE